MDREVFQTSRRNRRGYDMTDDEVKEAFHVLLFVVLCAGIVSLAFL